jgi:predicted AAA+ superfamily ATPase
LERTVAKEFISWKEKKERKPLILRGARQVGKTYLMKTIGKILFEKVHYFNFEKQPGLNDIFIQDLNSKRIISELEMISEVKIENGKSLIIFDEIQQSPKALNSLKYFAEDTPDLHVCAAGSLLGLVFSEESFPVGMVEYMDVHPMSFDEFLMALGESKLNEFMCDVISYKNHLNEVLHTKIWTYYKWYLVVGGLPEVVKIFIANKKDLSIAFMVARKKQKALVLNYISDIAKHCGKINASHIESVLSSVPRQLARNQDESVSRFRFKDVVKGLNRFSQLEGPISWLEKAGLIIKVPIIENIQIPLSAQVTGSLFKLYMFDVGILGSISDLPYESLLQENFGSYKGYIAENFIAQQLQYSYRKILYCWFHNTAEVEFICERHGIIYPLEVKSGSVTQSKSLRILLNRFVFITKAVVLSGRTPKFGDERTIDYFPLYFVNKFFLYRI